MKFYGIVNHPQLMYRRVGNLILHVHVSNTYYFASDALLFNYLFFFSLLLKNQCRLFFIVLLTVV